MGKRGTTMLLSAKAAFADRIIMVPFVAHSDFSAAFAYTRMESTRKNKTKAVSLLSVSRR